MQEILAFQGDHNWSLLAMAGLVCVHATRRDPSWRTWSPFLTVLATVSSVRVSRLVLALSQNQWRSLARPPDAAPTARAATTCRDDRGLRSREGRRSRLAGRLWFGAATGGRNPPRPFWTRLGLKGFAPSFPLPGPGAVR